MHRTTGAFSSVTAARSEGRMNFLNPTDHPLVLRREGARTATLRACLAGAHFPCT